MERYILAPSGRDDLDAIWLYIAKDNPVAATRVEQELIAAMRHLGQHPFSGHRREDLTDKPVRFWSVYSYIIVYDHAVSPVHILRILSGYRDVKQLLESE